MATAPVKAVPTTVTPRKPIGAECAGCPRMIAIPGGSLRMGAEGGEQGRPEGAVHQVRIARGFALAVHEVTIKQYKVFVAATGHVSGTDCRSWDAETKAVQNRPGADWRALASGTVPRDEDPVSCVSWLDAKA